MPKIIVAMSGGVDSSVTAYLLRKQGYEVEGLSFYLWEPKSLSGFATHCSLVEEASNIAGYWGISHSAIDLRDEFTEKVIKPFVKGYMAGSTPNPCVLCNKLIKFPFLLKEAEKRGAEYISTGHYARVEKSQDARSKMPDSSGDMFFLKKGIDLKKDQSYVLYALGQKELRKLILPLGCYRKDEVRKMAEEIDLPAAKECESQEICFIEDRIYSKFIQEFVPFTGKPGPIVDIDGKVLGAHKGIHEYTIGQRKRLGISSPEPLYVLKIDTVNNTICAGTREAAKKKEIFVRDLNWLNPASPLLVTDPLPPTLERGGFFTFAASVKIRSMMKAAPATIHSWSNPPASLFGKEGRAGLSGEIIQVVFDEPQWAPAPGQSAVFYDGDILMGGGVII